MGTTTSSEAQGVSIAAIVVASVLMLLSIVVIIWAIRGLRKHELYDREPSPPPAEPYTVSYPSTIAQKQAPAKVKSNMRVNNSTPSWSISASSH